MPESDKQQLIFKQFIFTFILRIIFLSTEFSHTNRSNANQIYDDYKYVLILNYYSKSDVYINLLERFTKLSDLPNNKDFMEKYFIKNSRNHDKMSTFKLEYEDIIKPKNLLILFKDLFSFMNITQYEFINENEFLLYFRNKMIEDIDIYRTKKIEESNIYKTVIQYTGSFLLKINEYYGLAQEQFSHIEDFSECNVYYCEMLNNSLKVPLQAVSVFVFLPKDKEKTTQDYESNQAMFNKINYTAHMYITRNILHDIFLELKNIKFKNLSIALHSYISHYFKEHFFIVNPKGRMENILQDYKLKSLKSQDIKLIIIKGSSDNKDEQEKLYTEFKKILKDETITDANLEKICDLISKKISGCAGNNQVPGISRFLTGSTVVFTYNFHNEWMDLLADYNELI